MGACEAPTISPALRTGRDVLFARLGGWRAGGPTIRGKVSHMLFRTRCVAVALPLVVLSAWRPGEASAGPVVYGWSPLAGSGYMLTYPGEQYLPFATGDACLTIDYDPNDPLDCSLELSSGDTGYEVTAYGDLQFVVASGSLLITATGSGGQFAAVSLIGDTGPLNGEGLPESLAGFADVYATGQGGYHDQFFFGVQSVPEPSGLLLAMIGLASLAAHARRRGLRRRG